MLILDLNQVMISNLMMQIGNHTNTKLEENMVRHMVLNTIRSLNSKFRDQYGELIVAADAPNCWRKQVFPYYKANRKKNIAKSELDWTGIFECMNKLREELKNVFPYRVIHIEGCEADDVIATLVSEFSPQHIMILSGDKDFIQLHKYQNVEQYDPTRKKKISAIDPKRFLKEHILRGDKGDGVPNVLSNDNCFVLGERQKTMTQNRVDYLMSIDFDHETEHEACRNYLRNRQLIDLSYTPIELQNKIISSYEEQSDKNRSKLMSYFIDNRLKNLLEHIGDF
jgi:hypothetical protein